MKIGNSDKIPSDAKERVELILFLAGEGAGVGLDDSKFLFQLYFDYIRTDPNLNMSCGNCRAHVLGTFHKLSQKW